METYRDTPREPSMEEVARQANYEGNESLLLFERLRNPVIRNQVVDLMETFEKSRTIQYKITRKETGKIQVKRLPYEPKKREVIERSLLWRLQQIETSTRINFSGEAPSMNSIPVAWVENGKKPSVRFMSAVEAHEKGHFIRNYGGLDGYFAHGFNPTAILFTEDDMAKLRLDYPDTSDEKIQKRTQRYLMSAMEIAERMSQLKNYFGFKGAEKFTTNHLKYVREHYIADTGIDNGITQFFQAITPETEGEFLRLINSSGI